MSDRAVVSQNGQGLTVAPGAGRMLDAEHVDEAGQVASLLWKSSRNFGGEKWSKPGGDHENSSSMDVNIPPKPWKTLRY